MTKTLWVPVSETYVTVKDGTVVISESMKMTPRPVSAQETGFGPRGDTPPDPPPQPRPRP